MANDREVLQAKIDEIAEFAKSIGENNAAIVFFSLAGSMRTQDDGELAGICKEFSKAQIEKMKEIMKSKSN